LALLRGVEVGGRHGHLRHPAALRLTSPERYAESKATLERIVSMLTKLAKNLQQSPEGERER
jgi:hypothetical protein